jgi:hypothetical protein
VAGGASAACWCGRGARRASRARGTTKKLRRVRRYRHGNRALDFEADDVIEGLPVGQVDRDGGREHLVDERSSHKEIRGALIFFECARGDRRILAVTRDSDIGEDDAEVEDGRETQFHLDRVTGRKLPLTQIVVLALDIEVEVHRPNAHQ